MKDLAGTGALVVGATGRLGEEIARKLSADRTRLVLAGRDGSRLEAVIAGLGGPSWIAAGDLTDPAAIDRLAADATARLDGVDLLIYAAGVDTIAATVDQSDEQVRDQLAVNLTGPIQLTRRLLPGMLHRRRGHVVYIGSLSGLAGGAYQAPYSAAKAGLDAWVRAVRAEHRGAGVGFSIIHPAPIRDVGRYLARRRDHGPPPGDIGETTACAVADAVLQAIRRDRPQVVVASRLVRAQLAAQSLLPGLAEQVTTTIGVTANFRRVAAGEAGRES